MAHCYQLKNLLGALSMFLLHNSVMAQAKKAELTPNIGIGSPILDNGWGASLALNIAYPQGRRLAVETQASYLRNRVTGSFLTGNRVEENALNMLLGGRVVLNSTDSKNHFYVNALFGTHFLQELNSKGSWQLGYSSGIFWRKRNLVAGLSYETPQHFIFKIGFRFRKTQ